MLQKYLTLISLTLFISQFGISQEEDEACLPPSKKIIKILDAAKVAPDAQTAVGGFAEAIKENPDNAMVYYDFAMYAYEKGTTYLETLPNPSLGEKSYKKAEEMFQEALNHCADYNANCSYYLGVINFHQEEKTEAIKWFKIFKNFKHSDPKRYPDDYSKKLNDVNEIIKELEEEVELDNNKVPFAPSSVRNVSTVESDEYFPMISPDNELMFYTRKVEVSNLGDLKTKQEEQFTYSLRPNISTFFDKGVPFKTPFNDGRFASYGAATMSVDNKELIFCACKNEKILAGSNAGQNYLNCDLYRTEYERTGTGGNDFIWTNLENMGPNINTDSGWEGQPTLSADGNTMYFTAMRPTTQDNDIYFVERAKDGKWGVAKPFDVINTPGKDKSPFLHQDSESLYFVSTCSETRKGAGGLDIFYIRKIDGVWSKPKNIGFPINSPEDELGIFVSTNGELAYYSSRLGGNWNIYSFELYEEARPSAVTIMKGTLNDENGKPIAGASIEIAYGGGSTEKSSVKVNGNDGKYAVVVKNPTKQDVMVTVKKEGYAFDSKLITKEEFASQAALAPKDVALGNKKEIVKKEVVTPPKTTSPKKEDVAMSSAKSPLNPNSKVVSDPVNTSISKPVPTSGVAKTAVPKQDPVSVKKAISSTPVDLEVLKIIPEATSKNTPVSMPKNDLVVKKLKVGVAYTINDVLFETSSSDLSERARFILKEFSSFLIENPTSKIMIQGHTDDLGEDSENLKLSEDRAKAVKDYLITLDIKSERMIAKGFGETMPKLENTTDLNRAKNRRTDFVLEKL